MIVKHHTTQKTPQTYPRCCRSPPPTVQRPFFPHPFCTSTPHKASVPRHSMAAAKAALLKRLATTQPPSGRPSASECRAVIDALVKLHGAPNRQQHNAGLQPGCELREPHTVLDSLVRTILSQNTTDITSQRAYTSLKQAFPSWESVRTAPPGAVEEAIRVGGLADIKAGRIKAILESLLAERGELSLEHLRSLPSDDIKQLLGRYKGVGPKSIACVMLFCLGRDEFAVDTHVWEISKQLGWVSEGTSREAAYEYLNAVVPDEHKYELHVLLVEHGKVCAHCFKRSNKGAGAKRKGGKGGAAAAAAAAAVVCPLAPFKQRGGAKSSKSSSGSAVAAAAAAGSSGEVLVAVKQEEHAAAAAADGGGGGSGPAAVAAAVKQEAGVATVVVKQEQQEQEVGVLLPGPTAYESRQGVDSEQQEDQTVQPAKRRRRRAAAAAAAI